MNAHPSGWKPLSPSAAEKLLDGITAPWWIAGGWALDLFVGKTTRQHEDLDIGILRRDARAVLGALPRWEAFEAKDGKLTLLETFAEPRRDVHSLWCRPLGSKEWQLEIMLDDADGAQWVFRRATEIRRALADTILRTREGLPFLAPEVQLLYKAKLVRPKDQQDFDLVLPLLSVNARSWLLESLIRALPTHPWIPALKN